MLNRPFSILARLAGVTAVCAVLSSCIDGSPAVVGGMPADVQANVDGGSSSTKFSSVMRIHMTLGREGHGMDITRIEAARQIGVELSTPALQAA